MPRKSLFLLFGFFFGLLIFTQFPLALPQPSAVVSANGATSDQTILFSDGFETGDFSRVNTIQNGGDVAIVSTPVHHGSYSMRCRAWGSPEWSMVRPSTSLLPIVSRNPMYLRELIQFTSLPTGIESGQTASVMCIVAPVINSNVRVYRSGSNYYWMLQYNTWDPVNGSQTHTINTNVLIETSVWYLIELASFASTNGWVKMWINRNLVASATEISNSLCVPNEGRFGFFGVGGTLSATITVFLDCIAVDSNYIGSIEDPPSPIPSFHISSEPLTSVPFAVNGLSKTTPYNITAAGTYTLDAEQTVTSGGQTYYFQYWTVAGIDYYESTIEYYYSEGTNPTAVIHYTTGRKPTPPPYKPPPKISPTVPQIPEIIQFLSEDIQRRPTIYVAVSVISVSALYILLKKLVFLIK